MQVGFRDLTVWSFLMASAHGAGLMVVPVLLPGTTVEAQSGMAGHHHMPPTASPLAGMLATGVHTIAYLAVTGLIAWVVYRKLGLALLRKAWFNFDLLWAAALVATVLSPSFSYSLPCLFGSSRRMVGYSEVTLSVVGLIQLPAGRSNLAFLKHTTSPVLHQ